MTERNTVLVTGANRGIGFEFVRQYAAQGWRVIAGVRNPGSADALRALGADKVEIERLDVGSVASVDALAAKLAGQSIDVLINNAGLFGDFETQTFGQIDFAQFDTFMRTNALGPLKMCEAFTPHVKASAQKKMISVTSQAGSFALDSGGLPGMYFYKSSKAAQNMIMRTVAKDVQAHGISVGILSPGMVNTTGEELPPERRFPGMVEPPESVAGMIGVIAALDSATTGSFIRYTGDPQPW